MESNVDESAPRRPNRFLVDLAEAMRSAAETAKLASIERSRAEAKTYVEALSSNTADEVAAMKQAAEADVATIRERSKPRIERVRAEAEQRIGRRRELLERQLADRGSAGELEVERVQARVVAFQEEVTRFFDQLPQGADPTVFARMASQMPDPPDFENLASEAPAAQPVTADRDLEGKPAPGTAAARAPLAPGAISGAGAVRGRYFPEWYVEVERLLEVGDVDGAVSLLLDIVEGTEAESRAEDVAVAPRAYADLAEIYRGRGNVEAEALILERFARQKRAPGPVPSKLMERLASLKGSPKR
jgi:gas vesicle protein